MDKLAAMTVFVRIAERGSLTAAAEALGTSLPSVVRTLAALERHLGARLFNRTTRRIALTVEGRDYLEGCRVVLAAVEASENALAARHAEPQGRLAVTAPVLFGRRYIAPILNAFAARHPKVQVELLLLDRVVNLVEEGIDAAVRIGPLRDSSLVAVQVGSVRKVVCATPTYLRRHEAPRSPSDVAAHRCISFTALDPGGEWRFHEGRRTFQVPIIAALATNQVDAALDACVQGLGLGRFLSYQVAPYRAGRRLRYLLEQFEPPPLPVHLVYAHARPMSARLRAFVDSCVSELRRARFE
jgi:DNA-binding transcriptional LysR family regulator